VLLLGVPSGIRGSGDRDGTAGLDVCHDLAARSLGPIGEAVDMLPAAGRAAANMRRDGPARREAGSRGTPGADRHQGVGGDMRVFPRNGEPA